MNITEDIHELVGRTPLIHLTHLGLPEGAQIYAKAELLNPGGSIKDRLGEHIIRKAEADGRLAKGGTILEITAGNTGICRPEPRIPTDTDCALLLLKGEADCHAGAWR